YEPRFNVAPTQRIVVIPTLDGQRVARRMRWGLVPSWAKDAKIGANLINARVPGRIQDSPLPDPGRWLLRVAIRTARQATVSHHTCRWIHVRLRRFVG